MSTARILLEGHRLRAIGVLEAGELVGTIDQASIAGVPGDAKVSSCRKPLGLVLDGGAPVRDAADQFVREDVEFAPVMFQDRYLGIVTSNMLLKELGQSWDPLTTLSWSDRLRDWGIENLKKGAEVTILFIDLDEFGQYNKRYGHLVGDRILQRVASMLSDSIDPDDDVLVRYGGDEFAIGTVRDRASAESLSELLKRRVSELFIDEAEESIDLTIGIYGGKRTKERENVHYSSTLNNLINLASKDCMAQKAAKQTLEKRELAPLAAVEMPAPTKLAESAIPIRVVSVFADDQTSNSLTQVIISVGDAVVSGVSARMGKSVIESIAHATAKALERKFPNQPMAISDIHLTQGPEGQRMVTVSAQVQEGEITHSVGGVKAVEQDLYSDVALATLQAFQQAKLAS